MTKSFRESRHPVNRCVIFATFNERNISALCVHQTTQIMDTQPKLVAKVLYVFRKNLSFCRFQQSAIDCGQLALVFDTIFRLLNWLLLNRDHRMAFASLEKATYCSRRLARRAYVTRTMPHVPRRRVMGGICHSLNVTNSRFSLELFARFAAYAHDAIRESQIVRGADYARHGNRRSMIVA